MRTLHINGMTPPALAIAIALKEKHLDFAIADIDWRKTPSAFGRFSDSLEIRSTLEGEFPILVDGATVVSDSYFVLEYLDDAYPMPRLRPDTAFGQWELQALARFLGERTLPAVSTIGVAQQFLPRAPADERSDAFAGASVLTSERREAWLTAERARDPMVLDESRRKLALLFERLDGRLASGDLWLLGEAYSLSDIAAFALVHPFAEGTLESGIAISGPVSTWHDRVRERPAVRAALALRDPVFLPGPEHARWG